mgnify:FL=1
MKKSNFILINSLSGGGAERQVSLISKAIGISKIVLLNNNIKYDVDVDKYVLSKAKIYSSIIETLKIPIYVFKLINFIKKFKKPSVIVSFLVRSNLINILTGKILGYKIIISERNTPSQIYTKGLSYYYGYLIKWCYPFADKIIVNSYGIKNDLIKTFDIKSEKIDVIYNAIDIKRIDNLKNETLERRYDEFFNDNNILINVGSLTDQKGQEYLIKILHELKNKKYKLVIIGIGKLKNNLLLLAHGLRLKVYDSISNSTQVDNSIDILFLNYQDNPYKYINLSTIFLFTSLWEGFPNVLLESMACKVPIVSSDCMSGPREMLSSNFKVKISLNDIEYAKYGILVSLPNNDNIKLWVNAINSLMQDKSMSDNYSQLGYERVYDFDKNKIIEEWKSKLN